MGVLEAGFRAEMALDWMADMERTKEYLKMLWRVLVAYDLVCRETGKDPEWVDECLWAFRELFHMPYEMDYGVKEGVGVIKLLCKGQARAQKR